MNEWLAYERRLYFSGVLDYIKSRITREDNYLIWKYVYYLRREEQAKGKFAVYYFRRRKNSLGSRLGLQIYAGTCAKGLHIWHYGSILISGDAAVGEDCTIHSSACIGSDGLTAQAPRIGNHVDIGIGAKIIGNVTVADRVRIGAGAVVVRSCLEEGAVLVGVPAKPTVKK